MEILELIERIGAFAGFAAIIGLAVLSALYFSHARDLKRLREWAGRAPERTAEDLARAENDAAAQSVASRPVPAAAARPAPMAATATPGTGAAGAGAATAAAGAAPAAAAEAAAAGEPVHEGTPPAPTIIVPGGAVSAPADEDAGPDDADAPGDGEATPAVDREPGELEDPAHPEPALPAATNGGSGVTAERPPVPPAPRRPVPPPLPSQRPGLPSRLGPPPSASPPRERWYRRIRPAYLALLAAGVLILGGAVAYGVGQLSGGGDPAPQAEQPTAPAGAEDAADGPAAPSEVTFSVLNGTTVDGLAKQVADKLEAEGYRRGNVTNASEQGAAESAVLYADGARGEAQAVAKVVDIPQIERIDPGSRALAGDATVVVVVGTDQTP